MRFHVTGFAAEVLGATLDDLARVTAERDRLRALVQRLREWDHLDSAADGAYWKREMDAALAEPAATDGGSGG